MPSKEKPTFSNMNMSRSFAPARFAETLAIRFREFRWVGARMPIERIDEL